MTKSKPTDADANPETVASGHSHRSHHWWALSRWHGYYHRPGLVFVTVFLLNLGLAHLALNSLAPKWSSIIASEIRGSGALRCSKSSGISLMSECRSPLIGFGILNSAEASGRE